ncbi:hypothetical protein F4778DRAFT_454510 [Xylariomycetidae sp. FL2044]|nr:hypothetical protein F4778DRAFT_454510 [Xylariomycetidae sp. FL2044]
MNILTLYLVLKSAIDCSLNQAVLLVHLVFTLAVAVSPDWVPCSPTPSEGGSPLLVRTQLTYAIGIVRRGRGGDSMTDYGTKYLVNTLCRDPRSLHTHRLIAEAGIWSYSRTLASNQ